MWIHFQFLLLLTVILVADSLSEETKVRYDYYHVYRITPDNESQISLLRDMEAGSDSIIFEDGIHAIHQHVDVIIAPHKIVDFKIILEVNKLTFSLLTNNLQADLGDFSVPLQFNIYNNLENANNWLKTLPDAYPGIVTIDTYGMSFEERELICVKISYNNTEKEGIFVEAGMNGNEWIAPATALYLINELLTSNNAKIQRIARSYDWYIIPHVNPDGFEYTHTMDRMWRKTRKPYGSSFGTNLNRNFNFKWSEHRSKRKPCSSKYVGPKYESESESYDLVKLVFYLQEQVKLYISLHAFGQRLEYPMIQSNPIINDICKATINALKRRYGTDYTCGSKFKLREAEYGNFMDWVYNHRREFGPVLAYSYKLRPSRSNYETGFQLDENQIVPTALETLDSLIAMIERAEYHNYLRPNYSYLQLNNVPTVAPLNIPSQSSRPTHSSTKLPKWYHDELF